MSPTEASHFLYTAWFRNNCAQPGDEDFEWPACFVVVAATERNAKIWGDYLSRSFSRRQGTDEFLWSKVEVAPEHQGNMPVVTDGNEVSDGEIGW